MFFPCPTYNGNIMPWCQEDNGNRNKNKGWTEMRHRADGLKWVCISLENIRGRQGTWEATVKIDDRPGWPGLFVECLREYCNAFYRCEAERHLHHFGSEAHLLLHPQQCRHGWHMSCTEEESISRKYTFATCRIDQGQCAADAKAWCLTREKVKLALSEAVCSSKYTSD